MSKLSLDQLLQLDALFQKAQGLDGPTSARSSAVLARVRSVPPKLRTSSGGGFCGMIVSFGESAAEPSSERKRGEPWPTAPPVSTALLVRRYVPALMSM